MKLMIGIVAAALCAASAALLYAAPAQSESATKLAVDEAMKRCAETSAFAEMVDTAETRFTDGIIWRRGVEVYCHTIDVTVKPYHAIHVKALNLIWWL